MVESHKSFRLRPFISLLVMLSALGLALTGLAMEMHGVAPLMAIRRGVEAAHTILAYLFIITGIWHAVYNGKAIVIACKPHLAKLAGISREMLLATGLVIVLLVAFVSHNLLTGGNEHGGRPGGDRSSAPAAEASAEQ